MPRYDFKCRTCGHVFEERTVHTTQVVMCPKCEGTADKQPAAPNFVVKGFSAANGYSK